MIARNYIIALVLGVVFLLAALAGTGTIIDSSSKELGEKSVEIEKKSKCVFGNLKSMEDCRDEVLGGSGGS